MKTMIKTLGAALPVSAASLAVVSAAQASATQITCAPAQPGTALSLKAAGTSCQVAHDLERWFFGHEWVLPVRLERHMSRGDLLRRCDAHVWFSFATSNNQTVFLATRYDGS